MAEENQTASPKAIENMNQPDVSLKIAAILRTLRPKRFEGVEMSFAHELAQPLCREAMESFATDNKKGVVLTGSVGTGKSAILYILRDAYSVWNYLRLIGKNEDYANNINYETLKFSFRLFPIISHFELVAELRRIVQGEGSELKIKDRSFIAIDDLGRGYEDESGWNLALLEEFIDYRWSNNLITCVSTNQTIADLRKYKGWGRIVDRILDPSWNVLISLGKGSRRK